MNIKQLIDIATDRAHYNNNGIWLWEYPNNQKVWATPSKIVQLDEQRKQTAICSMRNRLL